MPKSPNILFVMTDHTSAAAVDPASPCLTPNLDALAAEGVRLRRFYTTNAICSPARASLMTGLYPSTHGMWDCTHTQRAEWVDVPAARFTYFSQILAGAGYDNVYYGKWHVEQSKRLEDFGWREYDVSRVSAPTEVDPASRVMVRTEGYEDIAIAGTSTLDNVSHPAFDRAIAYLRSRAASGGARAPFCCFVSTGEPHDPYYPPRRFHQLYDREDLPLSPTLHDEARDKPEVIRRMQGVWSSLGEDDWRRVTGAYYGLVSFLDHELGRLLDALRDCGEYDDTIIVFTSDHGDMLGGHGLLTKGVGTSYEEVYNIPLVMRVPGMRTRGEDRTHVASMVDLAPTLLDLAGVPPLENAQGRSLRPVLAGVAAPDAWQHAYAEFFGQRFVYTQRIVWHGEWKYVFTPGGVDELYNLDADPHEQCNLAGNPAHGRTLLEMTKRMWRRMKEIGDESLLNSHYATLRTAPVGPKAIDE